MEQTIEQLAKQYADNSHLNGSEADNIIEAIMYGYEQYKKINTENIELIPQHEFISKSIFDDLEKNEFNLNTSTKLNILYRTAYEVKEQAKEKIAKHKQEISYLEKLINK